MREHTTNGNTVEANERAESSVNRKRIDWKANGGWNAITYSVAAVLAGIAIFYAGAIYGVRDLSHDLQAHTGTAAQNGHVAPSQAGTQQDPPNASPGAGNRAVPAQPNDLQAQPAPAPQPPSLQELRNGLQKAALAYAENNEQLQNASISKLEVVSGNTTNRPERKYDKTGVVRFFEPWGFAPGGKEFYCYWGHVTGTPGNTWEFVGIVQ